MRVRALGAVLGGGLIVAVNVSGAEAYFADGPDFELRGGAAAVTAQAELGPVELAIRDQLAELTGDTPLLQRDAEGVIAFYEARGYQAAWTADGSLTDTAVAIIGRLATADTDGLDPSAYDTPDLDFASNGPATPAEIAAADIELSVAVAAYTREAYAGRIDPRTVGQDGTDDIDIRPHYPDTAAALRSIVTADDAVATLVGFNPTHAGYLALRNALAEARAQETEARVVVPDGPTLRLGDADPRVAILRARLDLPVAQGEDANLFDDAVESAVRDFQSNAGLVTDGIVGPHTIGALNGPNVDPVAEIIANMERWRWMPRDLGNYYVMVNIPEFMVRIVADGEVFHETRVIVGQTTHRTPVFSDEIEKIAVNPYWYVPASIIAAEMMPILRSDPGYFVRNGYDVFLSYQGGAQLVNPYQVAWGQVSASRVSMRQRPGTGNALGQIKFLFPNSHAVYLHDTPSKSLFQSDVRAYSHGCVRVMNPMDFAEALLSRDPNLGVAQLRALFGDQERQVPLDQHIPIHITYFTAMVDDSGQVQFKNDIYGYSAVIRERLGLNNTLVAAN
jgi:murein L,D-transpeptidase YcbB/YkuD